MEHPIYFPLKAAGGTDLELGCAIGPYPVLIKSIHLIDTDGIASATDAVKFEVKNGSTVIADWDTATGQDGALTADTAVDLTINAGTNFIAANGAIKVTTTNASSGKAVEGGITVWVERTNVP